MDILVKRVPTYVNQFQPTVYAEHPSLYRCGTASVAVCLDFQFPGKFDVFKVEHDLYVKLDGADVAQNKQGVTKEEIKQFFDEQHVAYVDMQALVDEGNATALYDEIEAQNRQGVIQFLTVNDESFLREAVTNEKLHNWNDQGLSHCIVRVGFSDDEGYGFYLEPAAPGFHQPIKISWSRSIVPAKIITALAIMPPDVAAPPADFLFSRGSWPKPKKEVDTSKLGQTLAAMVHAAETATAAAKDAAAANEALQAAIQNIGQEIQALHEL